MSSSEDDDAKAHPGDAATTGLHTKDRLLRLARQITGKKSIEEVMGALHAMWEGHKKTAKLSAKVEKLEADARTSKVSALIDKGVRAGKLTPGQRTWAKTLTPAALKAYLDAAPKLVHTSDDEHTESNVNGSPGAVTAEMARIWRKLGHSEKDFPDLLKKMNGTKQNGVS